MSNVSTGDRQSIARHVVVALVAVIVAAISVNAYFDWKFGEVLAEMETIQRSISTHMGQIKALLKE